MAKSGKTVGLAVGVEAGIGLGDVAGRDRVRVGVARGVMLPDGVAVGVGIARGGAAPIEPSANATAITKREAGRACTCITRDQLIRQ